MQKAIFAVLLLFVGAISAAHVSAVAGGVFQSLFSHKVDNLAYFRDGNWASTFVPDELFTNGQSNQVAVDLAGNIYWVGSSSNILKYNNGTVDEPGYATVRVGGPAGTFYGSIDSIAVDSTGATLYVCGAFSQIGQLDTQDNSAQIYTVSISADAAITGISALSGEDGDNNGPTNVNCANMVMLNDILYVTNGSNFLWSTQGTTWSLITVTGGLATGPDGRPFLRYGGNALIAFGFRLDSTDPYNPTDPIPSFGPTLQLYTAGTSWSQVVDYDTWNSATINDFVVGNGGQNEVYITLSSNGYEDQDADLDATAYVLQTSLNTFNPVAPTQFFAQFPSTTPLSSSAFSIYYDVNLGTLVAFGAELNALVTAPYQDDRNGSYNPFFYAKIAAKMVMLNGGSNPTAATATWSPAYNGGVSVAPDRIFSAPGFSVLFSPNLNYVYDVLTGGAIQFDHDNGWELTDLGVDSDGWPNLDADPSIVTFPNFNGYITSVFYSDDVGLLLGGRFRTLNRVATTVNSIALFAGENDFNGPALGTGVNAGVRINDGDNTFEQEQLVPGYVAKALIHNSESIFVAGTFDMAGGVDALNVAVYDLETNAWAQLSGGLFGSVNDMLIDGDELIVVGSFDRVGQTIVANNVAAFHIGNRHWVTFNQGIQGSANVVAKVGKYIFVGGSIGSASGRSINDNIAVWDGDKWQSLNDISRSGQDPSCAFIFSCNGIGGTVYDIISWGNLAIYVTDTGVGAWSQDDAFYRSGLVSMAVSGTLFFDASQPLHGLQQNPEEGNLLTVWNENSRAHESDWRSDVHVDDRNIVYLAGAGVSNQVIDTWPQHSGAMSAAASFALVLVFLLVALLF